MAQTAPKVSFPDPIKLPELPSIVAAGTVQFRQNGQAGVSFPKPIGVPYVVLVTGDGANGGATARTSATFAVRAKTPEGFVIYSDDHNCRQEVSYIAVRI